MSWIPLGAEATEHYLAGELTPLEARETEHGVEVWMPHDFPARWEVHRICQRCGLLPLDYDSIEVDCTLDV